jgi:ElaB/YqjD/DUF883 family membrane-anchored ribosome-binding protein
MISIQLKDLKEAMTQRFNDIDHRIDDLKTGVDHDMDNPKATVQDLKDSIWKAVGAAGTVVGLIIDLLE